MRKPAFCICENKVADQRLLTAKLISAFVFATRIVQSLYFLYTKFQATSHLLYLNSLVCNGPGRKPRRPVFSQRGSFYGDYSKHFGCPKIYDFYSTKTHPAYSAASAVVGCTYTGAGMMGSVSHGPGEAG